MDKNKDAAINGGQKNSDNASDFDREREQEREQEQERELNGLNDNEEEDTIGEDFDEDTNVDENTCQRDSNPRDSNSSGSNWWDLVRCSNTGAEDVPEPESELIDGEKTLTHLGESIEVNSHEPERNPRDFYYVKDHVRFAMKAMLKELKAGLYLLKTEDFEKRNEILAILEDGYNQAKQLINDETRRN